MFYSALFWKMGNKRIFTLDEIYYIKLKHKTKQSLK